MKLGSWQKKLFNTLLNGERISTTATMHGLAGKARKYAASYQESINSLIRIMEKEGFIFEDSPGPCGGKGVKLTHVPISRYIELQKIAESQ